MKHFSFIVVIALVVIFQANPASAWQLRHTLRGLVETSPLIITGKVSEVSSKIEKDIKGHEVVYTHVTVDTQSVLKGELDKPSLTIKMLGGMVDGKGGWSEEWIPFKMDEELLLFLHPKDKANNLWEMKSGSGKLPVVNNNGQRCFDCSVLRADEVSQYDSNACFEDKMILNRIKDYLSAKRGGN